MSILYHGSKIPRLAELRPASKGIVYLTPNRTYALFYIRDREIDWVTCAVRADGVVWYEEQFQDQLRTIYGGVGGYVYACAAGAAEPTRERDVWIARKPVEVTGAEHVPDVYEEIVRCEALGLVSVARREEMTEDRRRGLHENMARYIREGGFLRAQTRKAAFLAAQFPEAWRAAQEE
jgi:hypothetical protein